MKCPHCRGEMTDLGEDLRAPSKNNKAQWEKLRLLARHQKTFHSCGCNGPGYRPKTLRETRKFVSGQIVS